MVPAFGLLVWLGGMHCYCDAIAMLLRRSRDLRLLGRAAAQLLSKLPRLTDASGMGTWWRSGKAAGVAWKGAALHMVRRQVKKELTTVEETWASLQGMSGQGSSIILELVRIRLADGGQRS